MEKAEGELKVFSSILLQEYVRIMTMAHFFKTAGHDQNARFHISHEHYTAMTDAAFKMPLIGLNLDYDAEKEILSVTPDQGLIEHYDTPIMKEVVDQYYDAYAHRYHSFIFLME